MSVTIVILAAGASSRMGQPKQLLKIGNDTMLERVAKTALNSDANEVYVVLGANAATIEKEVAIRDRYAVSIEDGEDEVACLIVFVLIDGIYHAADDDSSLVTPLFGKKGEHPHEDVKDEKKEDAAVIMQE